MKPGLFAAAITLTLFAQTGPSFEVASIRENPGPWHVMGGYSASGSRLTLEGWFVRSLVEEAYDLKSYRVIYTGDSANLVYNIVAKAEGEEALTRDQFRPLLQRLLADRFALKVHRETREIPVYVMVEGKNGPKFKESNPEEPEKNHVGVNGRNQSLEFQQGTMGELAERIPGAALADRPVIDQTGLTGKYDIHLEATLYFRINNNPQPDDLSIFDAIQQQLGLRLEAQKMPMEVLVVDHVEKPTEN
ncbi:MAG TPA: TIGR03435 family protein [Bryobacteraceae bacterium]|nr:TIGR03435 family protein [Bryobacteraceae bacterium]